MKLQLRIHDHAARIQSSWRKIVTGDERKRIRDHIREKVCRYFVDR